jgi:hypothetical protein
VELAVLAAGVDAEWQLGEQPLVVAPPGEGGLEHAPVDADERGLEACVEELARQHSGVVPPEREQATLAGRGETTLPVGTNILQEQIAERDRLHLAQWCARERLGHPGVVDLVDAARRDQHLDERYPECLGLPREQLASNAVHADPLVARSQL